MGLEKQGSRPTGLIGKMVGRLMNKFQTILYIEYFKNCLPPDNSKLLNIGSGGGKFLKYLSEMNNSYLLFGLDHSIEMVKLSKKVNERAIDQKRLKIIQGSVTDLSFKESIFDVVTAFETVQFWPDIDKSFFEIWRVLKSGGFFLIINRYPAEGSKWWEKVKIKSDKDYINKLEKAGFEQTTIDLNFKPGWIVVKATK